jgi:protein KTI12
MAAQSQSGGVASLGGPLPISLLSTSTTAITSIPVDLPQRVLTLSELLRQKRQFINIHKKAVTQGLGGKAEIDWTEQTVATKFANHLRNNLTM